MRWKASLASPTFSSSTYAQLDDAATKIAFHLTQEGMLPGAIVALCFEKSRWYTVAAVGALKAGAVMVPLDPSQPIDRLSSIVQQTKTKFILSSKDQAKVAGGLSESVVIVNDVTLRGILVPATWSAPCVKPWDLAYILFTSGTTGKPKGVMIEHLATCSSALHHGRATGMCKQTRTLQFSRHTFDVAISEVLTTLIFGGCIVVPSEEQRMNNITAFIREKKANWAFFTPSFVRLLDPNEVPDLHTVILGGEALSQDNIEKWAPGRHLMSGYGPTETAIYSAFCSLPPTSKVGQLGRGVGNMCWITDPQNPNRLMPIGAVGELLHEGPQLARGYIGFKEGEGPNASFIWDPPWLVRHERRGRLYRTGDLCRFDENGVLHFEARKDTQLKISGQRLEAGEVEHHLRGVFGTPHVVVDVIGRPGHEQSATGDKALVAFVCLEKEEIPEGSGVIMGAQNPELATKIPLAESTLAKKLPTWMIPSVYIPLRTVPLGANGKTDAKRLRAEAAKLSIQEFSRFMLGAPEETDLDTEVSAKLGLMRDLWVSVLGIDKGLVSRKSSLFRLGGDSITAMRLVAAARTAGYAISVAEIFRSPVLEDQCELLRKELDTLDEVVPRIDQYELLPEGDTVDMLREIAQECGIRPDEIEDALPCTPLQEGFMALTGAETPYVAQHVLRLAQGMDIERLKRAWNTVASAHGILRTRIVSILNAGMVQVVVEGDLEWAEAADLASYFQSDIARPSGFGVPLNRFGIVRTSTIDENYLVWSAHHAVSDGLSIGLTLGAVKDEYHDKFQPPIAEFSNFISHIRDMDNDVAAQYWRTTFQDGEFATFPQLPSISYVPQPKCYVRRTLAIPAQNLSVTPSTILRAAWALVVSLFSGSEDVVFGVTSTGRNTTAKYLEAICGPTIATAPLRIICAKDTTVQKLLEQTQAAAIDMIPFEQLGLQNIGRLGPDCHAACAFQSLLIVQPDVDMSLEDSPYTEYMKPQGLDPFNAYSIMVECELGKAGDIRLNANYDDAVVDNSQMTRFVDYFEAAVQFLCLQSTQAQPIKRFLAEPIASDVAKILNWNITEPIVVNACVHKLFEKSVQERPEKQAIFAWDGCVSYRELEAMASKLARKLVELGVGPEVKVPYCFEKSKFTVVSMLAILKAGGTMVPIDPDHPEERRRFILEKIGARVVTASTSTAPKFQRTGIEVVTVSEALFETLESKNTTLFSSDDVVPSNAAAILFTSGSTGTPKGVVQEHRTLCSAAYGESEPMLMTESSRILQFSAHVFDVSIIEIVNSLILGATLCIPSDEDRISNLPAFMEQSRADWAFFTPSFAATIKPTDIPGLKILNLGGEAVDRDSISTWENHVSLVNSYGPCEAAVCIVANISEGNMAADSIGRGANTLVWLADPEDDDRLVPLGSVGEILLEGPSVARGYYDDEEKTAASFISNPKWIKSFNVQARNRVVYKTGDLGRHNADGSVVYLGRKDTQLKVRGQRVELGEIEHHLAANLPGGSAVAVDAIILPNSATKSLVAFVRYGEKGEHMQAEQTEMIGNLSERLKQLLGAVLPVYMIPSVFIPIENMPITPTGKLDRRSLKGYASSLQAGELLELTAPSHKKAAAEPLSESDELAMAISRVLADLLSVGDPEYGDRLRGRNFHPYQAGMDSIQVISLSTFVRKTYGVNISVHKYMRSDATVKDIAGWIMEAKQEQDRGARTWRGDGSLDFLKEIEKYDAEISKLPLPATTTQPKEIPETVFLTGATGFLGSQILAQLLLHSKTKKVIALVRGRDADHARERLLDIARSTPWWRDQFKTRIEVWHGDLAAPRLGLDEEQWARLSHHCADPTDDVDAIIHNGAVVHWLADYKSLIPANISSTVHLLHAVSEASTLAGRPVPRFTYVSGGHLSTAPDDVVEIAEAMKTSAYPAYSQTKFVAENLVKRFADRQSERKVARSVSIVKPGLIMGDSLDGIANTDDYLWRVTASALDVGIYNGDEHGLWVAAAGVDLVARAILRSCFNSGNDEPTVQKILAGIEIGEFWRIVMEETGRELEVVDTEHWVSSITESAHEIGQTHRMWPVLHLMDIDGGALGQSLNGLSWIEQKKEQDAVRTALRKSLRYLIAIGYMQPGAITSSDDEEGGMARSGILSAASSVFTRTPRTPLWEVSRSSPKGGLLSKNTSAPVTPLRMPSPPAEAGAKLQGSEADGYFEARATSLETVE